MLKYDRVYIEYNAWQPESMARRIFLEPGEEFEGSGFTRRIEERDLPYLRQAIERQNKKENQHD